MAICKNKKCSIGECDQTEGCAAYVPVVSNADRIRAMSDEELAMIIMCPHGIEDNPCIKCSNCLTCCVDWLKQPADMKGNANE